MPTWWPSPSASSSASIRRPGPLASHPSTPFAANDTQLAGTPVRRQGELMMRRPAPHFRTLATVSVGLTLALTLGLPEVADAASTSTGATGGGRFPGASGSVAAITGSSMEVQNPQTGQVTVNWTTSTAFTQMATVDASS